MHQLYERLYEQEQPLIRKGQPLRVPELATPEQRLAYRRWRWEHKDRHKIEIHLAGVRKKLQAKGRDIIRVTAKKPPPSSPSTGNFQPLRLTSARFLT